jgi:hypothetical protein
MERGWHEGGKGQADISKSILRPSKRMVSDIKREEMCRRLGGANFGAKRFETGLKMPRQRVVITIYY